MKDVLLIICGDLPHFKPFSSPFIEQVLERILMPLHLVRWPRSLAVPYLAAYLTEYGYTCDGLDLPTARKSKREELIKSMAPNYRFIGFSCYTLGYPEALAMAKLCKKVNPDAKIVFGGPHASFFHEELLSHDCVDFVVRGEGEKALLDLVSGKPLAEVPALAYKNGKMICTNRASQITDLNTVPFPSRDIITIDYKYADRTPILTSRGCPVGCTYCVEAKLSPGMRFRKAENVVEEMEELLKNGIKNILLMDSNFAISKDHIEKIGREIQRRNLKFNLLSCLGSIHYLDERKLDTLKQSGFTDLEVGIESLSAESLKSINKARPALNYEEKSVRILEHCKKIGMNLHLNYMIGLPHQTKEAVKAEIAFLKKYGIIYVFVITPYPGTPDWERNKNKLLINDFSKFDTFHRVMECSLSQKEIDEIYRFAYPISYVVSYHLRMFLKGRLPFFNRFSMYQQARSWRRHAHKQAKRRTADISA